MSEITSTEAPPKTPTAKEMLDIIISECDRELEDASRVFDNEYAGNIRTLLGELRKIDL